MTPTFYNSEQGQMVAPALGFSANPDDNGTAVLDEDGIVLFTGSLLDAHNFMETHGHVQDWDVEVTQNRSYIIGFEAH